MAAGIPERYRQIDAAAAGIVHDLRAPLHVVLGWASLLRRKHDDPDHIAHALAIIERQAVLAVELLDELLERTRPSRTRAPRRHRHLDLAGLVRAEVRAVQPIAEASGVRLTLAIESPAVTVVGDEIQLRRVAINLLGNAVKFTPRDGEVECRLWSSDRWAGIAVRDSGPGIAPELLPRVFDPFEQGQGHGLERTASAPTRSEDGFGLGLTVVRHLVELHGGTVTAASGGSGTGSTFTVLLPAAPKVSTLADRTTTHSVKAASP